MKLSISNFPMTGDDMIASDIVALARVAEDAGIDRLCIADYPFHEDCTVLMMACLAATTALEVESLVTTPFRRPPDVAACVFATLAELSAGRAILGVGRGGGAAETWVSPWGFERPRALEAVAEFIAVCREFWAGGTPAFEGEILHTSARPLAFEPHYAVPILVAARGPKMLRLAGALADIVHLALPFLDLEVIGENLAAVRSGVEESGRSEPPEIDLTVALSIDEDEDVARQAAKPVAAIGLQWTTGIEQDLRDTPHGTNARGSSHDVVVDPAFVAELSSRWNSNSDDPLPADLAARVDDGLIDRFVVAGNPEQCSRRIAELIANCHGVTGLRLKLPKIPGPGSLAGYAEMARLAGTLHAHLDVLSVSA